MHENITNLVKTLEKDQGYYLNGGCYEFARAFIDKYGGIIRYLILEYHVVVELGGKLYDSSGNVTSKYNLSRYISGEELMLRNKILSQLGG